MHDTNAFLHALTIVLCVAAVTTVLFQRLRQPVVLGSVIAGLIVGPHVPVPLVADPQIVHTLSELGVILLMFSLGLEFSLHRLLRVGPGAVLIALAETSFVFWIGVLAGRAFGWSAFECLFTGAILSISSTTIIAKTFDEQKVQGRLRELVIGILVVEDLIAILLIAALTAFATGSGLSAGPLALVVGRLAVFLIVLIGVGLVVVPRVIRVIRRLDRPETTLVAGIGICFAAALLARSAGYSGALGAFLAGSLVAESGEEKPISRLVEPVRDMFAAIFFVSVGMLIDPRLVAEHAGAIAALTALVLVGKTAGVSASAFLTGNGMRTSIRAGMSMAQIGEFSFILAALGLALGATREFLFPVAVAISSLTMLTTPWMVRASGGVASWADRRLPHPLQMVGALYGSWIERLRAARESRAPISGARRLVALLLADAALLAALVILVPREIGPFSRFAHERFGFSEQLAGLLFGACALLVATPLVLGVVRIARRLGQAIADAALPAAPRERVDLADAPRRMFVVTLQLGVIGLVAAPFLAITQPFGSGAPSLILLGIGAAVLAVTFWKSATNLEGHVRAGTQLIVQALASQSQTRDARSVESSIDRVEPFLPGLGDLEAVPIASDSVAANRTLADLNLRGVTGATVLAVRRADGTTSVPNADETLQPGEILVLTGTQEAVEAARAILLPGASRDPAQTPVRG
jgi:CPA2 family monovalent cation:H+ antiporter-2